MSDQEITRILGALEKELAASNFATCVGVLEELARTEMTVAALKRTRAGVRCAALKDHAHAPLAAAARECVRKWKQMAERVMASRAAGGAEAAAGNSPSLTPGAESCTRAGGEGAGSAGGGAGGAGSGSSSAGDDKPPSIESGGGGGRGGGAADGGASASASASASPPAPVGASVPLRLPPRRQAVLSMLTRVLAESVNAFVATEGGREAVVSRWGFEVPAPEHVAPGAADTAALVEAALFQRLGGANGAAPAAPYGEQFRCLASNLKTNSQLAAEVYFGRVEAEHLAVMTNDELASEETRKKAQEIIARDKESTMLDWGSKNRKALLEAAGVKPGQGIRCPKCKGQDTTYFEKQTRSGDEPMTRCVGGRPPPPPAPQPSYFRRRPHNSPSPPVPLSRAGLASALTASTSGGARRRWHHAVMRKCFSCFSLVARAEVYWDTKDSSALSSREPCRVAAERVVAT